METGNVSGSGDERAADGVLENGVSQVWVLAMPEEGATDTAASTQALPAADEGSTDFHLLRESERLVRR